MQHSSPRRSATRLIAVIAVASAVTANRAFGYPDGPPDGFCGNPPIFQSCNLCHADFVENSGDGLLELLGLPPAYTPGGLYDLTVRLRDPGQMRWGFMMTVLDPMDQASGTLALTDVVHTQLSDNPGTNPDYIKHTLDGTYAGTSDGPVTWSFRWTAPIQGAATFYLAANAANGANDPAGDYIYTIVQTVDEATVGTTSRTWSSVKALYRP